MTTTTAKGLCLLVAMISIPLVAAAQGQGAETIHIRKLTGLARRDLVPTPAYNTSVSRTSTKARDWLEVKVTYDTAPEWIDELVIEYFVMMALQEEQGPVFSLFRKTVRYMDVAKRRHHQGVAYLRPSALERFGKVVAVAVEMSHDGQVVAMNTEVDRSLPMPERWWREPRVLENPAMKIREHYLLNRAESPWAYVNMDDYEAIK